MKRALLCGLLLLLAPDALAHRLDEYLQVTRVSVSTNRIELSVDLTPGVAVADQVLSAIDTDHDGQISGKESAVYAERILRDLEVRLDEELMTLTVSEVWFPSVSEMKVGLGVIRLKASAPVGPLSAGRHALSLTNAHLPAISVYLVNALTPKDRTLAVTEQIRDEFQQRYRLEFAVAPARQ
jgi:hypothetical protein